MSNRELTSSRHEDGGANFRLNLVCAIASRFYPNARKGLYEQLMSYAQLAAGTALISGPKNVETVSAYILLSLYPVPMRRWEEDRTWLYLGLAIRCVHAI